MRELRQGFVFKILWKEGSSAKTVRVRLHAIDGAVDRTVPTVYFWIKEFKYGGEDIIDHPCSARPPIDHLDADILCVCGTIHSGLLIQLLKKWASYRRRCTND
jgi:hypothetical protein